MSTPESIYAKGIPTLRTQHLVLRPFANTDGPRVKELAGAWELADTTLNLPHPYLDGMAEGWISNHAREYAEARGLTLAITLHDGTLIGAISLMGISARFRHAELGYWIGRPYWGQGYCTEAAAAIVGFGFGELHLHRVHACHMSRNPASGRVQEKIGMQHEGRRRDHVERWGKFEDIELRGILAQDWAQRQGKAIDALTIRSASRDEAALLADLIRRSFLDVAEQFGLTPQTFRWHPSNYQDDWIRGDFDSGVTFFLAEVAGVPAGCVGIRPPQKDGCVMIRLGVVPEHRHRGIGKALADHVIDHARTLGLSRVDIDLMAANTTLRAWYESMGFVYTGTRSEQNVPFEIGSMTLPLKSTTQRSQP